MPRMRGAGKRARASSSGPPSAEQLYRSEEHYERYVSLLPRRVIQERLVVSPQDRTNPIDVELQRRGWGGLTNLGPSAQIITQEFYANAWQPEVVDGPRVYTSYVRGIEIRYDAASIQRVLRTRFDPTERQCPYQAMLHNMDLPADEQALIPLDPQEIFQGILSTITKSGTEWQMTQGPSPVPQRVFYVDLVPVAKFWYKFSVYILLPSTHHHDVNVPRALLIYLIMTGVDVDVCTLLADSLYETAYSRATRGSLGHSSLIQTLCLSAGVIQPTDTTMLRESTTLSVSSFLPTPPAVEGAVDAGAPADIGAPRAARRGGRAHSSSSQFRSLHRRVNLVMRRQDRLQLCMDRIMESLHIAHPQPEPVAPPPPTDDEEDQDEPIIDSSSPEI